MKATGQGTVEPRTARLLGERLTQEHFAQMHVLHSDPEFMLHLGGVRSPTQTHEYLDRNIAEWEHNGFGVWILRDLESGEFVGRGGLRVLRLEETDEVEIGWGLRPAFWGLGLATEFAHECLRIARDELQTPTVVATTSKQNHASERVAERLGMVFEREVDLQGLALKLFRVRFDGPSNPRLQRGPVASRLDTAETQGP